VEEPRGRVRQFFHDALKDEWDGLERINRDLRLADLFTLLNATMGFAALVLAAHGHWRWSIHLVFVGIIMDGVDGAVARMGKGNGPLGGALDTLADACTFCATPAVVAFVALPQVRQDWHIALYALPLGLYFLCGLLRLARFESLRDGRKRFYFSGIPSPAAAGTLMALVLVGVHPGWLLVAAFYLGLLMVSRIRYPKLRGWWGVIAVTVLLAVLVTFQRTVLQTALTWALLVFMAVYVVLGPFYVLARYGPARHHGAAV